ncbi:MAG: DedA family protein [Gemmatimonadota bacterium]|nr:DedA family protein [Gemmatimonadota bacterium]
MIDFQDVGRLIDLLVAVPPVGAYAIIAAGAALENLFPPIPSDTFVVLGAVLSDRGNLVPLTVLIVAWVANVAGAMFVYVSARRYGPAFFTRGWGRWVLRPSQFNRVSKFYRRYGLPAIFFSRFLPVLRVVIPTFAGFAEFGWFRTLLPIAVASALWYAVVLYFGILASQNVSVVLDLLGSTNGLLIAIAGVVSIVIGVWWFRTRRDEDESEDADLVVDGTPGSDEPKSA